MEAKEPEIILGATICDKLRNIYHPDKPWADCFKHVASKFTELKTKARKFYVDRENIEVLKELSRYNEQDIMEMMAEHKDSV